MFSLWAVHSGPKRKLLPPNSPQASVFEVVLHYTLSMYYRLKIAKIKTKIILRKNCHERFQLEELRKALGMLCGTTSIKEFCLRQDRFAYSTTCSGYTLTTSK